MPSPSSLEGAPLADYFWIAGVDGAEVLDMYKRLGEDYRINGAASPGPALADAIQEDADAEEEEPAPGASRPTSTLSVNTSRRVSSQRLSTISQNSEKTNGANSNRSSMTVKGASSPVRASALFGDDFDFDQALFKFANERDTFLTDLNVSAGAITKSRPRSRIRTQKIVAEDQSAQGSPNLLKSGIGSVRRHMSFRDMNSMKRQPSVARQGKPTNSGETANCTLHNVTNETCSLNSLCAHITKTKQLQFGDTVPATPRNISNYAPVETKVRACLAGPTPSP